MQSNINDKITIIDENICKNIDKNKNDRGFLSQNILSKLRNLIEHIALKIYNEDSQKDLDNDYKHLKEAGLKHIKDKEEFKFLHKFYSFLQSSVSHYTPNETSAEMLMLKYYEYLIRTKMLMKEKYNFSILENLSDFPLKISGVEQEYYEEIAKLLEKTHNEGKSDRYYIHTKKPFFVNGKIYYEISFTAASDKVSKFDRILAFTSLDIMPNYAVRLGVQDVNLSFRGKKFPIKIIKDWRIDIRPSCEIDNFYKIFKPNAPKFSKTKLYEEFMQFLTKKQLTLLELIELDDDKFNKIKEKLL